MLLSMLKIILCDYQNWAITSNSSTSLRHIIGQKNIIKITKDDYDYDSQWTGQRMYGTLLKKFSNDLIKFYEMNGLTWAVLKTQRDN